MNSPYKDEQKKKKGKKTPILIGLALVVAGLFGIQLGGFGLPFGGDGPSDPASSPAPESSVMEEASTPDADVVQVSTFLIEVSEDRILCGGEEITPEVLREHLLSTNEDGTLWELRDAHAKKVVYDEVKALLEECKVTFTEG